MQDFNQVTVIGRLGRDPEMNYTQNGTAVTKFSIAVGQGKDSKDKNNPNAKERTLWLNVVAWQGLAETAAKYLTKGSKVLIQGRLDLREYQDRNNISRTSVEVIASAVQFLDTKKQSSGSRDDLLGDDPLGGIDQHPF